MGEVRAYHHFGAFAILLEVLAGLADFVSFGFASGSLSVPI